MIDMKKPLRILAFLLVGTLATMVRAETKAYPVPWIARESVHPYVEFTDLPGAGTVRIYTVSGEEVISLPVATGQSSLKWFVVNSSGRKAASGVYYYLVEGNGAKTRGKLVVIR